MFPLNIIFKNEIPIQCDGIKNYCDLLDQFILKDREGIPDLKNEEDRPLQFDPKRTSVEEVKNNCFYHYAIAAGKYRERNLSESQIRIKVITSAENIRNVPNSLECCYNENAVKRAKEKLKKAPHQNPAPQAVRPKVNGSGTAQ